MRRSSFLKILQGPREDGREIQVTAKLCSSVAGALSRPKMCKAGRPGQEAMSGARNMVVATVVASVVVVVTATLVVVSDSHLLPSAGLHMSNLVVRGTVGILGTLGTSKDIQPVG